MDAYRVTVWYPNIKPEHRDSRTMSDGAQFWNMEDAQKFARRIRRGGGDVVSIKTIENASFGFKSLAEWDDMPTWTADQISDWRKRQTLTGESK